MIPPVFKVNSIKGRNAYHNLLGIWIERDLEHYEAILAQERFEWWYLRKWNAATIGPVILAACLIGGEGGLFLGVLGTLAAYLAVYTFGPIKRRMELIGHMIETLWAVADGEDFDTYIKKEAKALTRYSQFKGWSAPRIEAAMRQVEPIARKYV